MCKNDLLVIYIRPPFLVGDISVCVFCKRLRLENPGKEVGCALPLEIEKITEGEKVDKR